VRQEVAQPERAVVAALEELLEALMAPVLVAHTVVVALEIQIQVLVVLMALVALFVLFGAQVAHSQAQILETFTALWQLIIWL
jgi:hypothetical protein